MFVGRPRALSRFFIQALIIERASVFASSRVPKTARSTVTLITKFDTIFDADHRNSLFCAPSVSHHFLRSRLGLSPTQICFGEKCYAYHHDEDIRSGLYLHAAASSD